LLVDLGREGLCRVVLIHHPPLTTEKHFKRLTDAAAFQAMIRRSAANSSCTATITAAKWRASPARRDRCR